MFHRCTACLAKIKESEQGQGLVEYAMILLVVSIVSIGTLAVLGTSVSDLVQSLLDVFP